VAFERSRKWAAWLAAHHQTSSGIWLRLAKKGSTVILLTYPEALLVALAWGWIDAQKKPYDDQWWLQRFTPRRPKSPWSKINRAKAEELIRSGEMKPPGLAEVGRAKADGRWSAAYDSARTSTIPEDLERALAANRRAAAFFKTIDAANRYAILYRVQTAKKPETRASRIATLVAMLSRQETVHPLKGKRKKLS
jgi:uncharacterized protein YdeI (YjbR/CyaY-like superfamily)